ncbi:unnamed protein product [Thlaspi arvense]|uniref:F-box domain-containing protein n=1 Tax=Thlaspi arvense TaxID=13288 RepID=A0AAU9T5W2_THLAR|nr:unnamed protein product [Thlaspi arvense]
MAVISETSDNSNGNDRDPNKKPQQLRKKPKKVQKKVSVSLPDDLTEECLAYVGRCHYPNLSLISKTFHRLISLPKDRPISLPKDRPVSLPTLYKTRSIVGRTEPVMYACIGSLLFGSPSWYILHRVPYKNMPNTVSLRLRKIESLPPMPWGSAVVTIGYEMYVMGGCVSKKPTKTVMLIDCRFHTYSFLPSMRVARCHAATGVIDGKIYVLGGCEMRKMNWVESFDLKEKIWNRYEWSPQPKNVSSGFATYAVMEKRIYVLGETRCYTYEPRGEEGAWKSLLPTQFHMNSLWKKCSCVIDGMLFTINPMWMHELALWSEHPVLVYDPRSNNWRPLFGLQGFPANMLLWESTMVKDFYEAEWLRNCYLTP